MDSPATVTQIGKYEIRGIAGVGGMGVVYRGEDKYIGREVAIKTLTDATPELRQRFLDEARSGFLNHPNIVTLYDFGEHDGNPYIVMEFLYGESLEKVLRSGRPIGMVEKLDMVRQVCEGLGYAHQKGVIHRDIKPANVMVQPNGRIKIVDFGIARLENASGHTQTGAVIGTFHYIAPERLKGAPSDGRADLWSVGVMLYQLLTGRLPFAGEDVAALHKVVSEPFEPLSQFIGGYPRAIDQVMERALAKNPEDRYQTGEEMASDIETINEGLKRAQISEKLTEITALVEQEQFANARGMLLELQRLDPQNSEIKRILREVQERLSRQQKSEQIRQLAMQAEEAALEQKYSDAIDLYKQASSIDPAQRGLTEKIAHLRSLKERADKVAMLQQQAREAQMKQDLTNARRYIEQALELDEHDTNLRNELARIIQEAEQVAREGARRRLVATGRERFAARQYTEAIEHLREALQLDPADAEVQRLFQEAVARQEEDRRRKVIDQIVAEIQDCLIRKDLDRAMDLIQRALERLPGETALLRLKAETEKAQREAKAQALLDQTSFEVQNLLQTSPQEALACVQAALAKLPDEPRLIVLQERVVEQLKKASLESQRAQYLKRAQDRVDAGEFTQAIQLLETAAVECGDAPEVEYLLQYARLEKQSAAQSKLASDSVQRAQTLIGNGELQAAVAVLQPVAEQTGNATVDNLLRQTLANLSEVNRRIDAVVQRVNSLREQDSAQALQFLLSQPAAIQHHSRLHEMRGELERASEQERVQRDAIRQTEELLAKNELATLLEPLESVARAYGETPAVAAAIAGYRAKRTQVANGMLANSVEAARQCILAKQPARAMQAIENFARFAEFADPSLQSDWQRLAQEAAKSAGTKPASTGPVQIVVKSNGSNALLLSGVVVLLLAIAGGAVWYWKFSGPGAFGAGAATFMRVNAIPFAEVVSVTSDKGKVIALGDGDHHTPLRLEGLPFGSYDVQYKLQDGVVETKTGCVIDDSDHLCTLTSRRDLGDDEIDKIIQGQQDGQQGGSK